MPAPNFQTLYDFETAFESAVQTIIENILAAQSPAIAAQVWVSRELGNQDTPRIEVQFITGPAMTQRTAAGQAVPKQVPNAFEASLLIRVVTTREVDQVLTPPLHGVLRGLCRYAMSAGAKLFNSGNLPYWQVLEMLPDHSLPTLSEEKSQDFTQLAYHVWFCINNEAWPTS